MKIKNPSKEATSLVLEIFHRDRTLLIRLYEIADDKDLPMESKIYYLRVMVEQTITHAVYEGKPVGITAKQIYAANWRELVTTVQERKTKFFF
jgi:hypothetical protein